MGKYIVGAVAVLMGLAIVFVRAPMINGQSGIAQTGTLISGTATGLASDIQAIEGGSTVTANNTNS